MNDDHIKSVRLNETNQRALLTNMESAVRSVEESNRSNIRAPIHLLDIQMSVTHPDGGEGRFLVCLRNIASGGASFVHGGFLYPDSRVILSVTTIWGTTENVQGRIVNCRLVEGHHHEIGVAFEKPIDRRRYLTMPGETPLDPDLDACERSELAGRVLYVGESIADAKLVEFHLKDSHVKLETAVTCDAAVAQIKASAIDLTMLSSEIDGPDGASAIETIRTAGFKGPIVLVQNSFEMKKEIDSNTRSSVMVLTKPYSPVTLIAALGRFLSGSKLPEEGPIHSELASNPDAIELVEYYLGYVVEIAGQLRVAIEKDEFETAMQSCTTLMETGAGYGFPPISMSAKVAVTELSASMSINESITEIQRLLGVCDRIESKETTDDASSPASIPDSEQEQAG